MDRDRGDETEVPHDFAGHRARRQALRDRDREARREVIIALVVTSALLGMGLAMIYGIVF